MGQSQKAWSWDPRDFCISPFGSTMMGCHYFGSLMCLKPENKIAKFSLSDTKRKWPELCARSRFGLGWFWLYPLSLPGSIGDRISVLVLSNLPSPCCPTGHCLDWTGTTLCGSWSSMDMGTPLGLQKAGLIRAVIWARASLSSRMLGLKLMETVCRLLSLNSCLWLSARETHGTSSSGYKGKNLFSNPLMATE